MLNNQIQNMKSFLLSALSIIIIFSFQACGEHETDPVPATVPADPIDPQEAFFETLSSLCGETFIGEATYPENTDHPLVGTELRTHVSECNESMVRIELIRDGDYWHGAWVVERREDGLHLFHDHLGDVRTLETLGEDDSHGYGGYATDEGTATVQYFAADAVTEEMIPEASTNVWMMELDLENETFIYYLERNSEPRFRAELNKVEEEV